MHQSFAIAYFAIGVFAIAMGVTSLFFALTAILATLRRTCERWLPTFMWGLFGGLVFSSVPFQTLQFVVFGYPSWWFDMKNLLEGLLKSLSEDWPLTYATYVAWIPDFLVGFAVFGVLQLIILRRRLQSSPTLDVDARGSDARGSL